MAEFATTGTPFIYLYFILGECVSAPVYWVQNKKGFQTPRFTGLMKSTQCTIMKKTVQANSVTKDSWNVKAVSRPEGLKPDQKL